MSEGMNAFGVLCLGCHSSLIRLSKELAEQSCCLISGILLRSLFHSTIPQHYLCFDFCKILEQKQHTTHFYELISGKTSAAHRERSSQMRWHHLGLKSKQHMHTLDCKYTQTRTHSHVLARVLFFFFIYGSCCSHLSQNWELTSLVSTVRKQLHQLKPYETRFQTYLRETRCSHYFALINFQGVVSSLSMRTQNFGGQFGCGRFNTHPWIFP